MSEAVPDIPKREAGGADRRLSVAPMLDWTDRPCRTFLRQISTKAVLYTEMLHAEAVRRGPRDRLLQFPALQHPLVLQLGGSDSQALAEAARIGEGFGYDEINLNVGCPSDRVQSGRFGACLMLEPAFTAELVAAMAQAVSVPVTVKCRIGVDDQDAEADFNRFIDFVATAGCRRFIVHARKAWLKGLSPKENREIPPLDYERVHRLKQRRPDLFIELNGGIDTLAGCERHLTQLDGVMLGRAAYHDPYLLAGVDRLLGDTAPVSARAEIVARMLPHIEEELAHGLRLNQVTRHMIGLYHGEAGARLWRQRLSVDAARPGAGIDVVRRAFDEVEAGKERVRCRR